MKQGRFTFTDRRDLHWKELSPGRREKLLHLLGRLLVEACQRREGGNEKR